MKTLKNISNVYKKSIKDNSKDKQIIIKDGISYAISDNNSDNNINIMLKAKNKLKKENKNRKFKKIMQKGGIDRKFMKELNMLWKAATSNSNEIKGIMQYGIDMNQSVNNKTVLYIKFSLDYKPFIGEYIVKIIIDDWPNKAPVWTMITPNGRFDVNKTLCLGGLSHYHSDEWTKIPLSTLLVSFMAYFDIDNTSELFGIGHNIVSYDKILEYSKNSKDFNDIFINNNTNIEWSDELEYKREEYKLPELYDTNIKADSIRLFQYFYKDYDIEKTGNIKLSNSDEDRILFGMNIDDDNYDDITYKSWIYKYYNKKLYNRPMKKLSELPEELGIPLFCYKNNKNNNNNCNPTIFYETIEHNAIHNVINYNNKKKYMNSKYDIADFNDINIIYKLWYVNSIKSSINLYNKLTSIDKKLFPDKYIEDDYGIIPFESKLGSYIKYKYNIAKKAITTKSYIHSNFMTKYLSDDKCIESLFDFRDSVVSNLTNIILFPNIYYTNSYIYMNNENANRNINNIKLKKFEIINSVKNDIINRKPYKFENIMDIRMFITYIKSFSKIMKPIFEQNRNMDYYTEIIKYLMEMLIKDININKINLFDIETQYIFPNSYISNHDWHIQSFIDKKILMKYPISTILENMETTKRDMSVYTLTFNDILEFGNYFIVENNINDDIYINFYLTVSLFIYTKTIVNYVKYLIDNSQYNKFIYFENLKYIFTTIKYKDDKMLALHCKNCVSLILLIFEIKNYEIKDKIKDVLNMIYLSNQFMPKNEFYMLINSVFNHISVHAFKYFEEFILGLSNDNRLNTYINIEYDDSIIIRLLNNKISEKTLRAIIKLYNNYYNKNSYKNINDNKRTLLHHLIIVFGTRFNNYKFLNNNDYILQLLTLSIRELKKYINYRDNKGCIPLEYVFRFYLFNETQYKIVKILLSNNSNISNLNNDKENMLHIIISSIYNMLEQSLSLKSNSKELNYILKYINMFKEKKGSIDNLLSVKNIYGQTPLDIYIEYKEKLKFREILFTEEIISNYNKRIKDKSNPKSKDLNSKK